MRKLLEDYSANLANVKLEVPALEPPSAAPQEPAPIPPPTPMPLPALSQPLAKSAEPEATLGDYLDVVRKRLWPVSAVFALICGSCIVYGTLKTPLYRGETILRYEPTGAAVGSLALGSLGGGQSMMTLGPAIETQINLLTSLDMRARIAKKLGMEMGDIEKLYKVNKLSQSSLLQITVDDPDPAVAAGKANLIGDLFVSWDLELRSRATQHLLNELLAKRQEEEALMQALAERRKAYVENHEDVTLYAALANQLLDLEARKKELLQKFTTVHPEVLKLDNRIQIIHQKLRGVPGQQKALEDIERDLRVAQETFLSLSKRVEENKIALNSTVSYLTVVSRAIPPPKPLHRKAFFYLIGLVLGGGAALLIALVLDLMDVSLTTLEEIEKFISVPVLGVIPDFGTKKQRFLDAVLNRDRQELGDFPSFLISQQPPKSPQIEGYHSLWLKIQGQMEKRSHLVLAVTSTGMAEGKTLTAANFALACAQTGCKTLLIGADLRQPFLSKVFGLPKEPGFVDAAAGRCRWEEAVRGAADFNIGEPYREKIAAFPGIDNFKIMPGWISSPSNIISVLSSPGLTRLIAELRAAFDLVVFDTPPSLLFVDAALIGKHADGVVMVYRSGKMSRQSLRRAKEQVAASRARLLGVVMNAARPSDLGPGYGSYHDYGEHASPGVRRDG